MCMCVCRVCAGCVYRVCVQGCVSRGVCRVCVHRCVQSVCTGCVQGMYTGVYTEPCIGLCVQRYGPVHVSRGVSGGVCVHSYTSQSQAPSSSLQLSQAPGPPQRLPPASSPKQHQQAASATDPGWGEPPPSCLPTARPGLRLLGCSKLPPASVFSSLASTLSHPGIFGGKLWCSCS